MFFCQCVPYGIPMRYNTALALLFYVFISAGFLFGTECRSAYPKLVYSTRTRQYCNL